MLMQVGAYRLAGAEEYGLISFYVVLATVASLLDVGLGNVMTREAARIQAAISLGDAPPERLGSMLFTLQATYVSLSAAFLVAVVAASPLIGALWLHSDKIVGNERTLAIILMAVAISAQRPRLAFSSLLDGLERQVTTNVLNVSATLARTLLGLGVLAFIAPTATAFLISQIVASAFETSVFAYAAWSRVPSHGTDRYRFSSEILRQLWGFVAANSAALIIGILIQIGDKLILSALLPIADFGRYNLISLICLTLLRLTAPFGTAILPRMSAQHLKSDNEGVVRSYFTMSQATATALLPAAAILIVFRQDVLAIVLGGKVHADGQLGVVLVLLALGNVVGGLARSCHTLQVAEGNMKTALHINIATAAVYLPAILLLTLRFGMVAPAALWLGANAFAIIVFVFTAHRDALRGYTSRWVWTAVAPQAAIAFVVAAVAGLIASETPNLYIRVCIAIIAGLAATIGALATSSYLFDPLRAFLRTRISKPQKHI